MEMTGNLQKFDSGGLLLRHVVNKDAPCGAFLFFTPVSTYVTTWPDGTIPVKWEDRYAARADA